ncbi:MAG: carbohydrate ABC transporter permease [Clostridia bacterium]
MASKSKSKAKGLSFTEWFKEKWNDNSITDPLHRTRYFQNLVFKLFALTLIIGMCFTILYPVIKLFPSVFNDVEEIGNPDVVWVPKTFSIVSFRAAIRLVYGNFSNMLLSLLYAASIAVIQVFISAMAGYVLGRIKIPGGTIIFFLIIVTFVVPDQALLISQYLRFKNFDILGLFTLFTGEPIDLINKPITLYLLSLCGFGLKQSMFIYLFRQFFIGLPKELEEAALIDGCGFYKTYFKIALPNAVPTIMTVAILSFVWNYGDTYYTGYFYPEGPFVAVKLSQRFAQSQSDTIVTAVQTWFDAPAASSFVFDAVKQAAILIFLIPLLIVYFCVQKQLVENMAQSGITGE